MYRPRLHYIYKVTDRNGVEDIVDVITAEDIPTRWVRYELMRTYNE